MGLNDWGPDGPTWQQFFQIVIKFIGVLLIKIILFVLLRTVCRYVKGWLSSFNRTNDQDQADPKSNKILKQTASAKPRNGVYPPNPSEFLTKDGENIKKRCTKPSGENKNCSNPKSVRVNGIDPDDMETFCLESKALLQKIQDRKAKAKKEWDTKT